MDGNWINNYENKVQNMPKSNIYGQNWPIIQHNTSNVHYNLCNRSQLSSFLTSPLFIDQTVLWRPRNVIFSSLFHHPQPVFCDKYEVQSHNYWHKYIKYPLSVIHLVLTASHCCNEKSEKIFIWRFLDDAKYQTQLI